MLQAQALSVEVGGRLVVESADFTVMPRDKVGLVGRNGAGKTSLFRVLGGEAEPAAGRVIRKGAFGYLPQDPRIAGVLDGRTACRPRPVGPRRRRRAWSASRSCASPWRSVPTSATSPLHPGRGALPNERRLRRRQRGPGVGGRPRHRPDPHRRARSACSPAASAAASSWPGSCSPAATCCASTSRRTTSTSTPRSG